MPAKPAKGPISSFRCAEKSIRRLALRFALPPWLGYNAAS